MGDFFTDTMQGHMEALEIERGNIPLTEKSDIPSKTLITSTKEQELIDEIVNIRKENNISQTQLAALTGNKQQAISRLEKKENSPSLKLFYSIVDALGYDIKLVKRVN